MAVVLPERVSPNHFLIAIRYGHGFLSPQALENREFGE
jgi:hypothetical protein